jgi:hypothetical protein
MAKTQTTTAKLTVKIIANDRGNPAGKLADAELHFSDGPLAGLKLIGFAVWERRSGGGRNVTFPARQYGQRRAAQLCVAATDQRHLGAGAHSRAGARRLRGDWISRCCRERVVGTPRRRDASGASALSIGDSGPRTDNSSLSRAGVMRLTLELLPRNARARLRESLARRHSK